MPHAGVKDPQTVVAGGGRASAPKILGVQIFELGNVITRSGFITEVFRTDWPVVSISVRQVNWVQLNAGAVTDWHCHNGQTDHLIGVSGNIKLALWDGREDSSSKGATEIVRMGALRPVWSSYRPESGMGCVTRAGNLPAISTSSISSITTKSRITGGLARLRLIFPTSFEGLGYRCRRSGTNFVSP
jgi:dTDP-4-dehydrorhamnose 3,5-epimerase